MTQLEGRDMQAVMFEMVQDIRTKQEQAQAQAGNKKLERGIAVGGFVVAALVGFFALDAWLGAPLKEHLVEFRTLSTTVTAHGETLARLDERTRD